MSNVLDQQWKNYKNQEGIRGRLTPDLEHIMQSAFAFGAAATANEALIRLNAGATEAEKIRNAVESLKDIAHESLRMVTFIDDIVTTQARKT